MNGVSPFTLARAASSQQNRPSGPCIGFDQFAGTKWIYPNNLAVRGYQKQAVEKALFTNAMIVLPTGFGKTFIAAVVMYNFFRWYPSGKIIFVAPTRPLVAQQIEECKKITGIPTSDCVEITGLTGSDKRSVLWKTKRVFFATPQVIENDLDSQILPAEDVRCLVIDEAHRAQGGYAYVTITKKLQDRNRDGFRILALSATPGSDITRVKQVMMNLYIGDVMFKTENDIDLMQFKNDKVSKAWSVELVGKHLEYVNKMIEACDPFYKELYRAGVTFSADSITRCARYTLVNAMTQITRNDPGNPVRGPKGRLLFVCSACMTFSHNFELLTIYGLRPFYSSMKRAIDDPRSKVKALIAGKLEFDEIMGGIEEMFKEDVEPDITKAAKCDLVQGHPKLKVVKDLLMKHFREKEGKTETRAIVFSKYRESVFDIVQTLKSCEPVLKPCAFVGQSSGKNNKSSGLKQKDQIQMVTDFKMGVHNVLVATCVAEEGLDIGEVDLVINYDVSSSPISNTQRRGRTGRKRSGDIQTLTTKGYEEKKLMKAGASKRQVEDQLFKRENYLSHRYVDAPRMVPKGVQPVCFEHRLYPVQDELEEDNTTKSKPKRKRKLPEQDWTECSIKEKVSKSGKCEDNEKLADFDSPKKLENSEKLPTFRTYDISELSDSFEESDQPIESQKSERLDVLEKSEDSDIEWDDDVDFSRIPEVVQE